MKFEKILCCKPKDLLMYEKLAIDALKPEYNICKVAGSSFGIKRTAEFITKIRSAKMGKKTGPCSEERKVNIAKATFGKQPSFKGKTHSEEAKVKIGIAARERNLGNKHSKETIEKMRASAIGRRGCGNKAGNKAGFVMKEVTKRKISEALKSYFAAKKLSKEQ